MSSPWIVSLVTAASMFALQSLAKRAAPAGVPAAKNLARAGVYVLGVFGSIGVGAKAPEVAPVLPLAVLIAALCVSSVTDVESGYIFDVVTLPALIAEIAIAAFFGGWESSLQGALACASVIGVLYGATRGRAIGLGDLKLAACIGAGLGPFGGIAAIGAAFVFGGAHALFMVARRRVSRGDSLRFAPYMALGFAASFLWLGAIWE